METSSSENRFELPAVAKKFIVTKILEASAGAWFGPIYTVYMTTQGLSLFQVNLVNTVFMVLKSIVDPPTGNLGDKYGHLKVYLIGLLFYAMGMFTYSQSSTIWGFMLAESIAAVGAALISEALETWLRNRTDDKISTVAKSEASAIGGILRLIPMMSASLILLRFGISSLWLLSSLFTLLTFLVTLTWVRNGKKNGYIKESPQAKPISMKSAREIARKSSHIKAAYYTVFLSGTAFQAINMFYAEFIRLELGVEHLGWYAAFIMWGAAFGSYLTRKLDTKNISLRTISLLLALIGILILISGVTHSIWLACLMIFLHEIPRSMFGGTLHAFQNMKTDGNPMDESNRATLNSIISSGHTLGAAVGLIFSGILSLALTIQQTWIISGVILLLLSLSLWKYVITLRKLE